MSRSGYTYSGDDWEIIKWRGMVASSIRGKRGQKLLRDLLAALDLMPEKLLIAEELEDEDGNHCALGVLGKSRGYDLTSIDPEDYSEVATTFDIAECLAQEIVYMNDEYGPHSETPEHRWTRMRSWVADKIQLETNDSL